MTPEEESTRYAPESIANAPMMRPERYPAPGEARVTFAARRLLGLGTPCSDPGSTIPWKYDPIGGDG